MALFILGAKTFWIPLTSTTNHELAIAIVAVY